MVQSGASPDSNPEFAEKLAGRMRHYNVPGVSVAIINNHEIELVWARGVLEAGVTAPLTTETLFQAASISKPVTAMATLHFVEAGMLELDQDVNKRLSSWKVPENRFTRKDKVTLRYLLSHGAGITVSGFGGYTRGKDIPTLTQILNGKPPANSKPIRVVAVPGSNWRYSGGGYTVIQQLLEDVTSEPFAVMMQKIVLNPLDMMHSTFEQPLPDALTPTAATGHGPTGKPIQGKWHTYPEMAAAGLWTTPSDLARFAINIQRSYAGESDVVLNQTMAVEMLTAQIEDSVGLGLSIGGSGTNRRFMHGGTNAGLQCWLGMFVETGHGAVVMTNSYNGLGLIKELITAFADAYDWPEKNLRVCPVWVYWISRLLGYLWFGQCFRR